MKNTSRGIAVITGGTSGIGAGFAKEFARQGYDLLLIARDKIKTDKFVAYLKEHFSVSIETMLLDLSDEAQCKKLETKISQIDNLKILVNCAGYGINKDFLEENIETREKMISLHNIAVVRLTYQAIKMMKIKKEGIIVNVSSLAAFLGLGDNPIYSASKAFLKNFSENLYRIYKKNGIYVQSLCPGFTKTNFSQDAGFVFTGKMLEVEDVVKSSVKSFYKKCVCVPGRKNKFILFIYQILPRTRSHSIQKWLLKNIYN